ncbi:hypothetical protein I3843_11G092200 [Carya illinoinensis]|uniref:Uncharacterized protein n=1 Tax=Carya illinoinensis TaxID=32201 RepID=A0A8T1P1R8_CARIL|nr:hypothetical protein I3760_11G091000 [Carya illinoinensis]KAG2680266.1 hypothetical protein I3760_11G091000 [Carya illinoinensis]KAG6636188.1 hypothetical protein CIPAW_11G093400 [Carya illinoinensis]KAG6687822.1 hypothetical protein I3842_11G092600 [Carya illinoinensis]KAG6687823.1 hypothetical protein I3842_11G092600 [Carya illinoinensis]
MENGKNMNATGTQDSFMMKPHDQRQRTRGHLDVITRRMKNRERQRRYRARKRLEAESKKSCVINESAPPQVDLQQNKIHNPCMTRVHCKRDWKKDARRAHTSKDQDVIPNGTVKLTSENQTPSLASGIKAEPSFERGYSEISHSMVNSEMHRTISGRRDWKGDARKKKC